MNVVVTDRFDADAYALLVAHTSVVRAPSPTLADFDLSKTEALVIRSRTRIDRALLKRTPKLRLIVTSTSGFDHVDLQACAESGVKVMYTPNANAASACELTWALVLASARKLVKADKMIRKGDWNREPLMGLQLSGRTYGVVGLGRIGSRVAEIARSFGMNVIVCDPYKNGRPLEQILAEADVVSCHVPATEATYRMISSFEGAKPGLIFVNTSRGQIVEERVLTEGLDRGWLGAVGLDVFETEPFPPTSALLSRDRVTVTPHIGATTEDAFRQASFEAARKIVAFAQHGGLSDELPGNEPWMVGFRSP